MLVLGQARRLTAQHQLFVVKSMNKSELDKIRQQLFSLESELQDLEETLKESSQPVELDQSKVGRLSRMDAMQAQQMAMEASRRRQQQLLGIKIALRRIESGEYGCCVDCDGEIDVRRLFVNPINVRCINCA